MPKVKIPRKNISLDMTAMCDMAFLLLSFFILSANFRTPEPTVIDTPSASKRSAETEVTKDSIMTISLDKKGLVFFGLGNEKERLDLIQFVNSGKKLKLTDKEMKKFSALESFGIPFSQLKTYLNKEGSALTENHPGIPSDSAHNELKDWVFAAIKKNDKVRIAIKGDGVSRYEDLQRITKTLQELKLSKISFVTNLEGR